MTNQRSRTATAVSTLRPKSSLGVKASRILLGTFALSFLLGGIANVGLAQSEAPIDSSQQEVTKQAAEPTTPATGVKRGLGALP